MFKMYTRIFSDFLKTYLTFLKGPKWKRSMIKQLKCQKTRRTL